MQLRQVRDIEYQLLPGSDRQTTDIVIERDGVITVRPPKRMTPEQVDETVLAKRMWIYRNLAEWRDLNATRVTREWVSGETFLYLGSCYRLQLVAEQDEPLKLKDGRFNLLREVVSAVDKMPLIKCSRLSTRPKACPGFRSAWRISRPRWA